MLLAGAVSQVFVYGFGPNVGTVALALVLAALVCLVLFIRRRDAAPQRAATRGDGEVPEGSRE